MSLLDDILRSKLREVTQTRTQGPNPVELLHRLDEELEVLQESRRHALSAVKAYQEEQGLHEAPVPQVPRPAWWGPQEYYTRPRDPYVTRVVASSTTAPLCYNGANTQDLVIPGPGYHKNTGVRFPGLPEASAGTVSVDESWDRVSHDQRIRATVTMTIDAREYYRSERPEVLIEELARSLARILMTTKENT